MVKFHKYIFEHGADMPHRLPFRTLSTILCSQFSHVSFKKVLLHTQDNKISNWLDETVLPESYNLHNRVLLHKKKVFSNKVPLYPAAVDFVRVN